MQSKNLVINCPHCGPVYERTGTIPCPSCAAYFAKTGASMRCMVCEEKYEEQKKVNQYQRMKR